MTKSQKELIKRLREVASNRFMPHGIAMDAKEAADLLEILLSEKSA
jgi:DNA polymerase IIIc chi subunit